MSLKLLFLASLALSFQISATNVAKYTDTIGNVDVHIDIENAYTFDKINLSSEHVVKNGTKFEVSTSGIYQVSYKLNWKTSNKTRRQVMTYVEKNSSDIIDGSYSYGYARKINEAESATNEVTFFVEIESGDYLELLYKKNSSINGIAKTLPGESSISIWLIEEVVDTSVQTTCEGILLNDPNAATGFYTIDPDGLGSIEPFETHCEMDSHSGGWTLVAIRNRTGSPVQVDNITSLSSSASVISDAKWQVFFTDPDLEMYVINADGAWSLPDMYALRNANCTPLSGTLTARTLAHAETSGCNSIGQDYSLLSPGKYKSWLYDYSVNKFFDNRGGPWKGRATHAYAPSSRLYIYVR